MTQENNELWDNITNEMLSMSDEDYIFALNFLQNKVSAAICEKLDTMESEITNFEIAKSVLNKF